MNRCMIITSLNIKHNYSLLCLSENSYFKSINFVALLFIFLISISHDVKADSLSSEYSLRSKCITKSDNSWSDTEKWVWVQICSERKADLNTKFGKVADPNNLNSWSSKRILSSSFIKAILLEPRYSDSIPYFGVVIKGFWIKESLNFQGARIKSILWMDNGRFDKNVNFYNTTFNRQFTLDGDQIKGKLDLSHAKINGRFSISGTKVNGIVDFSDSDIKGPVIIQKSIFNRKVDFEGAALNKSLTVEDVMFKSKVKLRASINSSLSMYNVEFYDDLDMLNSKIKGNWYIVKSIFHKQVYANHTKIGADLNILEKVKFLDKFSLSSVSIDGKVFGSDSNQYHGDVVLTGNVKGGIQLGGKGTVFYRSLTVISMTAGELDINKAVFNGPVRILDSKVYGLFNVLDSKFNDSFIINLVSVSGHADFEGSSFQQKSRIRNFHVSGHLSMNKVSAVKELNMQSCMIGGHFWMENGEFKDVLDLSFSKISGNLLMSGSVFTRVDMNSTYVGETLSLWEINKEPARWVRSSKDISSTGIPVFNLRNASARVLQDHPDAWPESLDLLHFEYNQLGGFNTNGTESDLSNRKSDWFVKWLNKSGKQYHQSQPYKQLAMVLNRMGRIDTARDIKYSDKELIRKNTTSEVEYIWLTLSWLVTGYGLELWRTVVTFISLVMLGVAVLHYTGEGARHKLPLGISYSLEQALPIITLDKNFENINLESWTRYWFYVQRFLGYLLATLLITSLIDILSS